MNTYDAACPHCGHRNTNMYLEETDGWMECERCGKLHQFIQFHSSRRYPAFRMETGPNGFLHAEMQKAGVVAV